MKTELDFIAIYLVTITIIKLFNVSINNMFVKIAILSKTVQCHCILINCFDVRFNRNQLAPPIRLHIQ